MPLTTNRIPVSGRITATNRSVIPDRQNLILQSEDFVTSWSANGCSISQNTTTNPLDGLTTASTLVEDTANNSHYILPTSATQVVGRVYTLSAYVKPISRTWFAFCGPGYATASYYNLTGSGVLGSVITNGGMETIRRSIVDVGNGWYRCIWTYRCLSAPGSVVFMLATTGNGTIVYTGNGLAALYIYGAQVNNSDTILPYTKTTTTIVSTGTPRNSLYGSRDNAGALMFSGKGLLAYYKADPENITTVAGKISQWRDISASQLHMNQATSGKRPTYASGVLSGQDAISFTGAQVFATVGNIQNKANPFTCGIIFQRTGTLGATIFAPSTGGGLQLTANQNGNGKREIRVNGVGHLEDGDATLLPELWIVTGSFGIGTTTYNMYLGTALTNVIVNASSGNVAISGNQSLIGALATTPSSALTGYISECFFVDRVISSTEMTAFANYVTNKYGAI